jgi:predicted ester cyclase
LKHPNIAHLSDERLDLDEHASQMNIGGTPMSTDNNKALTRRFLEEGINQSSETIFLELLDHNVLDHYTPPGLPPGSEGWNLNRKIFRSAFPDGRWSEEAMIAEGDLVMGRYTFRGTHHGEFFGIPPTGKSVAVANIHILRFEDGQIVEHGGNGDELGMLQQLGGINLPA